MAYCKEFMEMAIQMAVDNVKNGTGGPFGAVVVCDGKVIAVSGNTVVPDHDPTAHAEINAIRKACRVLNSFQLTGCEIYASCEPCPMCLGAIYWARPDRVYYACSKEDAAESGFDDSFIYQELLIPGPLRRIPFEVKREVGAGNEFKLWRETSNKTEY